MEKIIVVLGGGGVKGLTHIGAWRAIMEAGIEVDEIVGTSIGAFVGAAVAAGGDWTAVAPRARAMVKKDIVTLNRWALLLNGIRQKSLFEGERFHDYVTDVLPVTEWSGLVIPVGMNAVDLESGEMVWFGAGGRTDVDVPTAVYASCALPVFYPPAEIEGRYFVDGGIGDTLAIERAKERGATLVIAVDATAGGTPDMKSIMKQGMVAIHHRVVNIMMSAQREAVAARWSGPRLIHVRPNLDGYSTFEFGKTDYFIEEGYRATKEALESAGLAV